MTPAPADRVVLVHWKPDEAAAEIQALRATGVTVDVGHETTAVLRLLRARPPSALVVDLSRLPSHGREVARAAREHKATRHVPIVFVGGAPAKVETARRLLPDAQFVTWRGVAGAVKRARARPASVAVVPSHRDSGYSGTPLPRKLGVKPQSQVALVGAPDGFQAALGPLPAGATLAVGASEHATLTVWFVRRQRDFVRSLPQMMDAATRGPLWIAWPKQASPLAEDLGQAFVREHALAAGLVDYKVCAIDADWSALAFATKRGR